MSPQPRAGADQQEEARAELGDSDEPVEDELAEAFDAVVDEGAQRLHRDLPGLLITGFFGGVEVGIGVLALLAVYAETGSHLLAGLAFGTGLVALLLAKSELFTEGFLVPVTAVAAGRATVAQLLRLWAGTLAGNLVGGLLVMGLLVVAFPDLRAELVEMGAHYATAGLSWETAVLAVLAGATLTLMTRMQQGADSDGVKVVAALIAALLLAGTQMHHSVLDSLLVFGALWVGAPFGWLDWLAWFVPAALLNAVGGLGLVTGLRLVRTRAALQRERGRAARGEPT